MSAEITNAALGGLLAINGTLLSMLYKKICKTEKQVATIALVLARCRNCHADLNDLK